MRRFSKPAFLFAPALLLALLTLTCTISTAQQNKIIPLWEKGAPGFESRRTEPESAKDYWVKNINNPSLEVILPAAGTANGTAVVVCPGGGFRLLVYNAEGREPGEYLAKLGITVFVLKYRLPREDGSPYSLEKTPREDALRAMRQVRSLAKEYNIDPARVGMLGFSAGGEVVAAVAYASGKGDAAAKDPIDQLDGKPDFQMLIYPGPLGIPETVPQDAPPAFLLAANDDPCCGVTTADLLMKYRAAKRPVEAHMFTKGDHGFNMGNRSKLQSIKSWPQRMADWLADNGYLDKKH
ncbi:alpha/beta hydrolase [Dyadobacter luticola]|uniref:Alpha/beta hydrolase n=1 Tax=Dyadobacter luticola TaxID=1979387 RepID=A0A5R9L4L2_9BACT|nr:alpha/beta hydrolase [Dyadobacter luticola]TLV03220.1 alpha/beta hydrolase [Dyadobacter luticola]